MRGFALPYDIMVKSGQVDVDGGASPYGLASLAGRWFILS